MKTLKLFSLLVLCLAMLAGCSDILSSTDETPVGNGLAFTIEVNDVVASNGVTRAGTAPTTEQTVTPMLGSWAKQSLFLRAEGVGALRSAQVSAADASTRGGLITDANFYDNIQVIAYDNSTKNELNIDNTATKSENWLVRWVWPKANPSLDFFAYAPATMGGSEMKLNNEGKESTATLQVDLPANCNTHNDLVVAKTTGRTYSQGNIPLTFNHVLTAIRFAIDNPGDVPNGITVKRIVVKGPRFSGYYKFADGTWQLTNSTRSTDFVYTLNQTVNQTSSNYYLQDGDNVMMMLPQTVSAAGSTMQLVYTMPGNDTEKTLTASIAGQVWQAGYTVTYHVTTSTIRPTYSITVNGDIYADYMGNASDSTFTVTSKSTVNGVASPEPWEIVGYSTDGGKTFTSTKPDWLTLGATSGSGNTAGETDSIKLTKITANVSDDSTHIQHLQAHMAGGANWWEAVDLSMRDAYGKTLNSRHIANCYVVHGYGWFKFPTVPGVGNVTTASLSGVLDAGVLMIDQSGVIASNTSSDIFYGYSWNDYTGYVYFYIKKANIKPANIQLAVRDYNSRVIWSWHIWVTDEDLTPIALETNHINNDTSNPVQTNYMMPVPLGFKDGNDRKLWMADRKVVVRVKQDNSTETAQFTVTQHGGRKYKGTSTYYQWGRKDPFVAKLPTYGWGQERQYYKPYIIGYSSYLDYISISVQNPEDMIYYSSKDWLPDVVTNLWNSSYSGQGMQWESVTKTDYDPCPYPFHVPGSAAFSVFADDSRYSSGDSNWNYLKDWDGNYPGWTFYTKSDDRRDFNTIFIPAFGYLDYKGNKKEDNTPLENNTAGSYWTAGYRNSSAYRAGALYFHLNGSNKDMSPMKDGNSEANPIYARPIIPSTDAMPGN